MIIHEISLKNFRQFKDEKIKFATDKYSNITLILGENTSGKTTLLQAFLWCFYGKANFDTKDHLFNEEIALEMEDKEEREIKVKVVLEHEDYKYIIHRSQRCLKVNRNVKLSGSSNLRIFYKSLKHDTKGETKEVKQIDVEHKMKEILPKDLSDYFFYDTERFGNITEKEDVTKAVKGLLGLTILENALKHLGRKARSKTVIGRFYNELNFDGDKKIDELHQELDNLETKIEEGVTRKLALEEQKFIYEKKLSENQDLLRGMESSMAIQEKIDENNKTIKYNEEILEKSNESYQDLFSKSSLGYFMTPLVKKVENFLSEADIQDEGIRDMNANSIEDIIKRGYCVCGTKIDTGSKEYLALKETLKYIPPQSLGIMINSYKDKLKYLTKEPNFTKLLSKIHFEITRAKNEISMSQHEIERYSDQLKTLEHAKNIQAKIETIKARLRRLNNQINEEEVDKRMNEKSLSTLQRKLNDLIQVNEKNEEIFHYLTYAQEVADWFQRDYDKRNEAIQQKIEKRVNYYFQQIYHGTRFVKIDPGYRVKLYSKTDNQEIFTDESTGLETVKNFSFIAGLVDMAKEKLVEANEDFNYEEEYPLVLDAPFSNVDEEHVINISRVLPDVAGQLILIVMEKDWNYAEKKLRHRVGKTYTLVKRSETDTTIREV